MIKDLDWLNVNENRAYPIHTGCGRLLFIDSDTVNPSGVAMDDSIVVDFSATTYGVPNLYLYISKLVLWGDNVSVEIRGFIPNSKTVTVGYLQALIHSKAMETFPVFSGTSAVSDREYVTLDLTPVADRSSYTGRITFGRKSPGRLEGVFYMDPSNGLIEPSTVSTGPSSAINVSVNGGPTMTGDIVFSAGPNMDIRTGDDGSSIVFSAIPGMGYIEDCEGGGGNVVRTINGIPLENFVIQGDDDCVKVTTSGNTVTISDTCSTPCCGCDELEYVTGQLIDLQSRLDSIDGYRDRLATSIETLKTVLRNI